MAKIHIFLIANFIVARIQPELFFFLQSSRREMKQKHSTQVLVIQVR